MKKSRLYFIAFFSMTYVAYIATSDQSITQQICPEEASLIVLRAMHGEHTTTDHRTYMNQETAFLDQYMAINAARFNELAATSDAHLKAFLESEEAHKNPVIRSGTYTSDAAARYRAYMDETAARYHAYMDDAAVRINAYIHDATQRRKQYTDRHNQHRDTYCHLQAQLAILRSNIKQGSMVTRTTRDYAPYANMSSNELFELLKATLDKRMTRHSHFDSSQRLNSTEKTRLDGIIAEISTIIVATNNQPADQKTLSRPPTP